MVTKNFIGVCQTYIEYLHRNTIHSRGMDVAAVGLVTSYMLARTWAS